MAGTEFDPDSFEWGKHYITGLVLPNGATEIKAGSGSSTPTFKYFTNLKTLSASGVVHIGDYAFYNCDSLTTVSLPTAATIGDYAFYGCDNLTLWQVTITFDADGGSPATQTKTVNIGSSVGTANWPSTPTRSGYLFNGWYTSTNGGGTQVTASTMVNGNITVYAKWSIFADLFLDEALTCLSLSAVDGGAYTITLKRNETIAPRTLYYASKTVSITIKGDSTNRTVSLSSNGSLFTIGSGVTLTLDNNVTLQGRSNNSNSLVLVESGGTLVMNTGSKVSDNRIDTLDETGGGVHVSAAGKFTMNGGTISGNVTTSASGGGGVQVSATGKFTMNGGTISGNATSSYGGGGVQVRSGTFVMNGGTISGNATFFSFSSYGGGGVYVTGGIFTMSGGTISDNTAGRRGGGVHVSAGTFNMAGGAISGNTAAEYGGGVYVTGTEYGSTFNKTAGIIYGDTNTTHTEGSTENTAESDGHAVYVNSSPAKKRNTTAGTGVTLNSGGYSDGWE
jgi:uncharacterized repeat protein (TIGR02543 family)